MTEWDLLLFGTKLALWVYFVFLCGVGLWAIQGQLPRAIKKKYPRAVVSMSGMPFAYRWRQNVNAEDLPLFEKARAREHVLAVFLCAGSLLISTAYYTNTFASRAKFVYENMTFLLTSDRNLETVQNIKALEGLREKRIEVIIKFMEVRVEGDLKYDGIKEATLARAKEYQNKYCTNLCLGIQ